MSQSKHHLYRVEVHWTGNNGQGTESYRAYDRAHRISVEGKPPIEASADPAFRGDKTKYNPEEMLVASLSSCHMLWYLHLCAEAKVVVTGYVDYPIGTMIETEGGSGQFSKVLLRPVVTLASQSNAELATQLHAQAHQKCFVANSVNFPVQCESTIQLEP
ncbi:OsmC family protein [Nodosilinea sp. LEGE 07298]|uniref:OsmC family protein n=1 Tax=Nodosilinea sp. LEGE 07298 TaxID=2777970 RepID=UPI0018824B62|nr:OsmC family protein [Nodosilinea sp. LEGE 07298]MBE9108859.1 OsmC family protein [Nodosilinea sp. LEGE 07298]